MKIKISKEVKSQIKESIIQSTSHGFPRIVASQNIPMRIFWILFTIASTGFCAYLIADNIMSYYNYEVSTKVRQKFSLNQVFPSITICNVNFFTSEYSGEFINDALDEKDAETDIEYDLWFIQQKSLTLNLTEIKKLGDSLDKFIIDAANELTVVDITDEIFSYFFHQTYGNCYTYNPFRYENGTIRQPKIIRKNGYMNAFYVRLNTTISKGISIPIRTLGAVVFIHEFGSSPYSVEGQTIAPGFETNIALHRTSTTLIPKPYSDCDKDTDNPDKYSSELFKDIHNLSFNYSQNACFDLCFHREMLKECSCYINGYSTFTEGRACLKEDEMNCVIDLYYDLLENNYFDNLCKPLCPLECYSVKYSKSVTFSKKFYDSLGTADVNIYFEDFSYTEIEENIVLTEIGLVSNIGGIAGLFLGVSFLSFIEIVAVFIEVFYYYLKKKIRTKNPKSKNIDNQELTSTKI
ncbi:unnamed protein product [Brachionus calyciflorus]|uniref:Uncharacterized protein n=1 Tax=Brachionus calyciflorus TaxID=104777 RepID=A0A813MCB1_9BILA|nr:unnamed protein product [Brachionus calyciflorus]